MLRRSDFATGPEGDRDFTQAVADEAHAGETHLPRWRVTTRNAPQLVVRAADRQGAVDAFCRHCGITDQRQAFTVDALDTDQEQGRNDHPAS